MTGQICVVVVLQSCTDSLRFLPTSSTETFPTPSDGTYDVGNIDVKEDVDVIGEINTAVDTGIKQEEIPEDKTFPDIKSEPDDVSYVYVVCPNISVLVFYLNVYWAHLKLHVISFKI